MGGRANEGFEIELLVVIVLILALIGTLAGPVAQASEASHDRARAALQAGQIVPLNEVLALLRAQGIGVILEIELEQHDGRWIYEVESLSPDGVISTHVVDAKTKAVLPYVDDHDDLEE